MSDVDARYLGLTANQLAKIATDLKAENAKLREQVSMWRACREDEAKRCDRADADVERLSSENDRLITACEEWIATSNRLGAENAKLRELCADMWEAIKTHKRINFAQLLRFGERVSELGVEAPS